MLLPLHGRKSVIHPIAALPCHPTPSVDQPGPLFALDCRCGHVGWLVGAGAPRRRVHRPVTVVRLSRAPIERQTESRFQPLFRGHLWIHTAPAQLTSWDQMHAQQMRKQYETPSKSLSCHINASNPKCTTVGRIASVYSLAPPCHRCVESRGEQPGLCPRGVLASLDDRTEGWRTTEILNARGEEETSTDFGAEFGVGNPPCWGKHDRE
jgi:hypothetical protein